MHSGSQTFPVISIVTPSYNQGQFIADTIESVINQEGDFYIDYIIMDGGSEDNSVSVIKKFAGLVEACPVVLTIDDAIFRSYGNCRGVSYRWVSEKDGGQSDAINRGMEKTVGEWVTWLCSDDIYLKGALNRLSAEILKDDADVIYGDVVFLQDNNFMGALGTEEHKQFKFLNTRMIIQQPGSWIRKNAWIQANGLNRQLNYIMDYELFIRLELLGFIFRRIPEFFAIARIYNEAKTSSPSLKRLWEYYKTFFFHHSKNLKSFSITPYILYGIEYIIKLNESRNLANYLTALLHKVFWRIARPEEAADIAKRFQALNPELYNKYKS